MLDALNTVGIVLRPDTPELKTYYYKVRSLFERYGIKCFIDTDSAKMIDEEDGAEEFYALCIKSDLLVSIGGDGTLIAVVRKSFGFNKPILGINMGRLGFLTDIQKDEIETFIHKLMKKDYRIDKRMLIEAEITGPKKKKILNALNDVVVTRKQLAKMVSITASINKEPLNTYFGDGLIISTPTGSTAYNISCGGPIVYPFSQIFIITPICPHSLTQRPLVLPATFEMDLKINDKENGVVVLDGQDVIEITPQDTLTVRIAKEEAHLIHKHERDYFKILREKFSWGNK